MRRRWQQRLQRAGSGPQTTLLRHAAAHGAPSWRAFNLCCASQRHTSSSLCIVRVRFRVEADYGGVAWLQPPAQPASIQPPWPAHPWHRQPAPCAHESLSSMCSLRSPCSVVACLRRTRREVQAEAAAGGPSPSPARHPPPPPAPSQASSGQAGAGQPAEAPGGDQQAGDQGDHVSNTQVQAHAAHEPALPDTSCLQGPVDFG